MTTPRSRLGASGERIAADFLARKGHRVVARNLRRREGEIDLVTVAGDTLVFVEVKVRRAGGFGPAVESITAAKGRRLAALAEAFAADHPELPAHLRIDVVAVELDAAGGLLAVRHVVNAVEERQQSGGVPRD